MSVDDRFRPDLKEKAHRAFTDAATGPARQVARTARDERSAQGVSQRVTQIRQRVEAHQKTMMPKWEKAERQRLRDQKTSLPSQSRADGPRPPGVVGPSKEFAREQSIAMRAEANVRRRCEQRIRTIDSIERRMVRDLTRNRRHSR